MGCTVPEEQIGRILGAVVLPNACMDRVLARIHLADEVGKVSQERIQEEQRIRRLGKAYVEGLYADDDYRRQKRPLEEKLSPVVPGVDAAREAEKLLDDLPTLSEEADSSKRRKLLIAMLDGVYVDTVEGKSIVAIRPKVAYRPLFEIATTRESSDVILINVPPPTSIEVEAADPCFWWRRGESRAPRLIL